MEVPCYEINDEGYIIEYYLLEEEELEMQITEGRKLVTSSWDNGIHTPKYDFTVQSWAEGNKEKILENMKNAKIEDLNRTCEESIEAGFISSNGHHYRTNRDDQVNMIGQKDELTEDLEITVVSWKTEDLGYIDHSRDEWLLVYKEAFAHKKAQLLKYDDLKKQVLLCQTIEEVQAIQWN